MRETRQSGSEGGGNESSFLPTPICQSSVSLRRRPAKWDSDALRRVIVPIAPSRSKEPLRYENIALTANRTLAGRSASRRMYQANH
jgi:hypothetical protein